MQIALNQETYITPVDVINKSFSWMFVGLLVTGLSSFFVASSQLLMNIIYSNMVVFFGLIIAELVLVFFLSLRITNMSFGTALISFLVYSLLNGIALASIFLIYTSTSIAIVFFISAIVFGVMAFYGYTTKQDLTTIGNLALMALLGIIIASLVNLFLKNDMFSYILSYVSIIIFIGLTAYDTQKIKQMESYSDNKTLGILGALTLYLDFINIFINLLRVMGRRRSD